MAYSLDDTQDEFFKDTVDIYRQTLPFVAPVNSEIERPKYGSVPIYLGIKCNIQATEFEALFRSPIGQTANENIFTRDKAFFHLLQDVEGMDYILVQTLLPDGTDHPNKGRWFRVVGDAESRFNDAMSYKFVKLEGSGKPDGVA